VIFCALDYLRQVGLTPNDIVVEISSRKLLAAVLKKLGIPEERLDSLYPILDKKNKLPPEAFTQMLGEQVPESKIATKIQAFMETKDVSDIKKVVEPNDEVENAINEQAMLIHYLDQMGVSKYCQFDPAIVRGLAYYTGIVYEIYDHASELRAIGGGGRYDNLLRDFGGPEIPATGLAIGDCVLSILLEEKGLIKPKLQELDYFVACVGNVTFDDEKGIAKSTPEDETVKLTAQLRRLGFKADFSYKFASLSKQLGEASSRNARRCIIIGEEFKQNKLAVKDMATGQQELVELDRFLAELGT
jgi:histidyl-tRNA synthetase